MGDDISISRESLYSNHKKYVNTNLGSVHKFANYILIFGDERVLALEKLRVIKPSCNPPWLSSSSESLWLFFALERQRIENIEVPESHSNESLHFHLAIDAKRSH
ncbi:hypothetical protein ROZALSC1DRAFT_20136 [Rozella allomycis CSF55]|uniref:Uncharacterized protein n=1 Tax=Rozella allomycis (strain CSF55) TaxID=988480 RepID=A0A4P9YQC2_ROZAC|nr:hypothetical protein ROZALSC1DRAFT_20136 [Rozella allomycis CSF55]